MELSEYKLEAKYEFIGNLCLVAVSFFGAIYYVVPIVKSVWDILVYPSYPVKLQSGIILFVIGMSTLIKFKTSDTTKTFCENLMHMVSYYLTVLFTWVFANFYAYWIY